MHAFFDKRLELTNNIFFALPIQAMWLVLMNIALIMLTVGLLAYKLKSSSLHLFWA